MARGSSSVADPAVVGKKPSSNALADQRGSASPSSCRSCRLLNQHRDQNRTTNQCQGRAISAIHAHQLSNLSPWDPVGPPRLRGNLAAATPPADDGSRLLTRRARNASGMATQCTRMNDSPIR
jgi:hypothetical protein